MATPCMQSVHPEEKKRAGRDQKPRVSNLTPSVPQPVLTQDDLKRIAACKAVEFVESGMVVGLGTGSTAKHAVARIAELLRQGKLQNIVGIPTSKTTEAQALSLGITLSDLDRHPVVDLSIDGADEIDPRFNLIKGRGGSLYREKRVESVSRKFIVIADATKVVENLGESGHAVPVEVARFGWNVTLHSLRSLFQSSGGCFATLRTSGNNIDDDDDPFLTDNMNYIVDLYFPNAIADLEAASDAIKGQIGVVEHGLFLNMATTVIIAGSMGVTVKNNHRAAN